MPTWVVEGARRSVLAADGLMASETQHKLVHAIGIIAHRRCSEDRDGCNTIGGAAL